MNHKHKVKVARKLQTHAELSHTNRDEEGHLTREGLFTTKGWENRKEEIRQRVLRKQDHTRKRVVSTWKPRRTKWVVKTKTV